jgi:hypothetical protein
VAARGGNDNFEASSAEIHLSLYGQIWLNMDISIGNSTQDNGKTGSSMHKLNNNTHGIHPFKAGLLTPARLIFNASCG